LSDPGRPRSLGLHGLDDGYDPGMSGAGACCAACGSPELGPYLSLARDTEATGLIPSTRQFGRALADIFRCGSCGHMQLDPMPDEAVLSAAYRQAASEDYVGEEAGQRRTARQALDQIEAQVSPRGTLLDLGCWVGFLLAEARDRGWNTIGVEPSEFASAYARDCLGLTVLNDDLFSADLPPGAFDVVTLGDVIEHLTDPGDALQQIRGWLAPGGVLWMALPDAGSRIARTMGRRWWSVLPTHVQYFTRGSMATLLHRHGFELLGVTASPKTFSVGYYVGRFSGYSRTVGRILGVAAEAAGVADRMWGPDFRDRMAVTARRMSAS
jgi:SAM-dependent methyltransferase